MAERIRPTKVIFMGAPYAGKTCLLTRLTENSFQQQFVCTIGVEFMIKRVTLGDREFKLQLWDTAGQERFRSLSIAYYRNADVCVVCFDLNNPDGLRDATQTYRELIGNFKEGNEPIIMMVGCKKDLQTKVAVDAVIEFCEQNHCTYMQTSAKTGYEVQNLLAVMVQLIAERVPQAQAPAVERKEQMQKKYYPQKSCGC